MTNVVKLKTETKTRIRKSNRRANRQTVAAGAVLSVALVLTALSLSHLSAGIMIVTSAPAWEAWSMAVGIDLGFVALEIAQMMMGERTAKATRCYTRPAIIGTLVGSAMMNAFAFGMAAVGYLIIPAVALGLAIPALIYAMTRVGAKMWLDR